MTRSLRIAKLLVSSESNYPWRRKSFPSALQGLAAEARKAPSFEDFEKDYTLQTKHGTYWHWTDDLNFRIDPAKGPRDMSSMAGGEMTPGKLMVTSHLENWAGYGSSDRGGRPFAALIDMSEVPRNQYRQVGRGFGNEFFVDDPSSARVIKVYPRQRAFRVDRERAKFIPQSKEALRDFYELVTGGSGRTASSQEIDLGGGVILKETTNLEFADEGSEWQLYDEKFPGGLVGYMSTYVYPEIGHTIGNIRVQPRVKGRGLGEKMVRALVEVYGSITSDPQGNTSPDAVRMWQRMGAEKVPTDKNTKGYFYKLTR